MGLLTCTRGKLQLVLETLEQYSQFQQVSGQSLLQISKSSVRELTVCQEILENCFKSQYGRKGLQNIINNLIFRVDTWQTEFTKNKQLLIDITSSKDEISREVSNFFQNLNDIKELDSDGVFSMRDEAENPHALHDL